MNRTGFASRLYEKIKQLGKKSGIGRLHPHMLRHTYLTRLYNVEHDLRFVQDQAGHASPTTTAIYAKTNSTARRSCWTIESQVLKYTRQLWRASSRQIPHSKCVLPQTALSGIRLFGE